MSGRNRSQDQQRLTLLEAVKDFGWLPLSLLSIGGGLSLIDIIERTVTDGLSLITPFQIVLDGYHRVSNAIGVTIEPLVRPLLDWLNAAFGWRLELQPLWRSLLVLCLMLVLGFARSQWRGGRRGAAILCVIVMGLAALSGAVVVGLLPAAGGWWLQGLTAAIPVALLGIATQIYYAIAKAYFPHRDPDESVEIHLGGSIGIALLFVVGAGLSFVFHAGAGLVALGVLVAGLGALSLFGGLHAGSRAGSRIGLAILGGFAALGMILISNWVLLALGTPVAG